MNYLIPANTKRGQLILNVFRPIDLTIFITGISVTVLLLAFFPISTTLSTVLMILPGAIAGFLVIPIPNYHNMLVVLIGVYSFFTTQRNYKWRGWCFKDEFKSKK